MKKIEISIPELGHLPGTCGWVAKELERINKTIESGEYKGVPCLYADLEGFKKKQVIVEVQTGSNIDDNMMREKRNGCFTLHAIDSEYEAGLFQYLTPKAIEVVEKYLEGLADGFIEKLNAL